MTDTPSRYINRELSWLEFNQRVLDEACNEEIPALERLKFLAITGSNLDEFFMVRVGGLQLLAERGSSRRDPSGLTADDQLRAISARTHRMASDQYACLLEGIEPKLAAAGLRRGTVDALSQSQAQFLEQVFVNEIYPILTPMAVTSADDFPLLANQSLNVCVRLDPEAGSQAARFAVIPFGRSVPRIVTLPAEGGYEYVLLEDAVKLFAQRFFPGEGVVECVPFRITRNADIGVREDLASDLLAQMQEVLDARKQTPCVRLEIAAGGTGDTLRFLQRTLFVADRDIYSVPGPLDLSCFMPLTGLKGFDGLRYEAWPPQSSPQDDPATDMFTLISRGDLLLYHPYESFDPVIRLIEEAAADPDVLAIKQTLYRTSRDSPIVAALMRAAERGKSVVAIVELKARFDEARNIEWARNLERAGVQVIYGVKGLKTHAKVCIIVRREPHGIQRYVHFGTGNYNEITARLYGDARLLTCDEELAAAATAFFNAVTGYSQPQPFRKIEAAPLGLRDRLLELIEGEARRKRQGQEARIAAKLNSLTDPEVIDALYEASCAGVTIDLNIRGICCLRPGVAGVSENVAVVGIVDRFLEHARIVYFHHGGDPRLFIASADWMTRNLDRRVELLVPVEDAACRKRLLHILELGLQDEVKGRWLQSDGSYRRRPTSAEHVPLRSQEALYREVCEAVGRAEKSKRTIFEPHRAPDSVL